MLSSAIIISRTRRFTSSRKDTIIAVVALVIVDILDLTDGVTRNGMELLIIGKNLIFVIIQTFIQRE